MTRKEAKRRAELYSALAEGKTIQVLFDCEWNDINIDAFKHIYSQYKYRIKPEPKYRPFKNQEECWQEMLKHQPFGWIQAKKIRMPRQINRFTDQGIVIIEDVITFRDALYINEYEFIDGTPFGIRED